MERIFEPFCQGSEQVWREKGGSGLGLTISKQFVELHGGRIWLESEVGVGTTFFVALPILVPLPPARPPGSWISREWHWVERQQRMPLPQRPDRPRVVIYDPTQEIEPGINMFAGEVEMVTSTSLDQVIAEVQTTPAHAVLFGANRADGYLPLLQAAAQELPDTPLLGWTLPARMAPALGAGADQYLVKPISLAGLRQRLDALASPIQRVLIADDDDGARLLLARMLLVLDASLEVKAVANGVEALQLLQSEPFDLLLLDVMMPHANGFQVLECVRSDPHTCNLPVIVISAQDLYETQPVCSEVMVVLGSGIRLAKALECALGVAQILFTPVAEQHPALG
jgi:CheY-like chemotaxis protein